MSLSQLFQRKLRLEMRLLHIVEKRPSRQIKLNPLDSEDFIISLQSVSEWSSDNLQLYSQILENGMAQFICNQEYLYDFYKQLSFPGKNLECIDANSLRFHNLKVLDLSRNSIKNIENVPPNCKELYLDFNQIDSIIHNHSNSLELLSLSHNIIDDQTVAHIVKACPQLRCLNIGWNKVRDLKYLATTLHFLEKLKVLVTAGNPISMLAIYRTYLTENLQLAHFDGEKYVKPEPPKPVEEPKQEKKEVKEEKKDSKKDTKKGGKVEEKPVQEVKVEPPKMEVKRQLTQQDFETVRITVKISNIQQFVGNSYDTSLFPADTDPKRAQTNYWLKYQLLGQWVELKQKLISFDNATIEGDDVRLNLQATLHRSVKVDQNSLDQFNEGLRVEIHQIEPKMIKDSETFELKPQITGGELQTVSSILGAVHVDFRVLHNAHKKELKQKYRLFKAEAVSSPLFSDPYENQNQLIGQLKVEFEAKLRKQEQERIKKAQEEELLKLQKKGGKDQKKAPQKKATKKEGKDAVVTEKKKAQKCDYPIQNREYCVVDGNRIYKGKELLCVHVAIQ